MHVYIYAILKHKKQANLKPNTKSQMFHHQHSSPFPSCFRPSTATDHPHPRRLPSPSLPETASGNPNLTTCLYQTDLGLFSLTWSRYFLGHSLHLQLHHIDAAAADASPLSLSNPLSPSTISFHLHIKPFIFWTKQGSKKLHVIDRPETKSTTSPSIKLFWDLSKAKFGSGPEPQSGFYIAVVVDREIVLLIGDLTKAAVAKTKARKHADKAQVLVLRREHVFGNNNKVYVTKVRFGGKNREISVDCNVNSDARLSFGVDNKRVLLVKRLKWKFRGNERIEVDGVPIQVSWDVYNWLFDNSSGNSNRHAVFMFRFETDCSEMDEKEEGAIEVGGNICCENVEEDAGKNGAVSFSGMELRKMRKSLMRKARSSSSSSISMSWSAASSSGCSSSVMEWASMEESELSASNGFSLLIYAWKK